VEQEGEVSAQGRGKKEEEDRADKPREALRQENGTPQRQARRGYAGEGSISIKK